MASCGKTDSPSSVKVAWGGAGIVSTAAPTANKGKKKAAWGPSKETIPTMSFRDLQSEDMARALTAEEQQYLTGCDLRNQPIEELNKSTQASYGAGTFHLNLHASFDGPSTVSTFPGLSTSSMSEPSAVTSFEEPTEADINSDFALAKALQYEFDLEHDMQVAVHEKQYNKNSKLSISYSNYRILPSFEADEMDAALQDEDHLDEIEVGEMNEPTIPPCGYVEHEGAIVTKHDSAITARRNTKKMMHILPLDVNTGDATGFQINMPNKVFNNLNANINSDHKRKQRVHDKSEKGTLGSHLDERTSVVLLGMQNAGLLEELGGVISTGKEAVVYHAVVGSLSDIVDETRPYQECVIKVFKTRIAEFKTRERYIRGDHRFKDRMTKTNNFNNIKLWVEKEYRNLLRTKAKGLPCPTPLHVRDNVLVMSLIGERDHPAPQIRTVDLSDASWERAYYSTLEIVHNLTNEAHLVHADLSEYNLLYYNKTVYVIDFAQAVDLTHNNAISYLYRDLCNIANFFHRKGVPGVKTGLELLEEITKLDIRSCAGSGRTTDEKIMATEQELAMWKSSDCYDDGIYEFLWNAAQMRQQLMQNLDFSDEELQQNLATLTLDKSGSSYKEEWITKKPDCSVTSKGKKKKKKSKKNLGNNNETNVDKIAREHSYSLTARNTNLSKRLQTPVNGTFEDETGGFCLVNRSDCDCNTNSMDAGTCTRAVAALDSASGNAQLCPGSNAVLDVCSNSDAYAESSNAVYNAPCDRGLTYTCSSDCESRLAIDEKVKSKHFKQQRVRFVVSADDTDAVAESEDYNADADTDEFDADTDDFDVYTDVNVTDCDTEGYHGDADDTDNNASDVNSKKISSTRRNKGSAAVDLGDSSDQQSSAIHRHFKTVLATHTDKRSSKKKNKKSKTRTISS